MTAAVGKIHHIGYLVKDIQKSIAAFQSLGLTLCGGGGVTFDPDRKAEICFLYGDGGVIELVSPDELSDIFPLLKKYNNAPYHICYEVWDLEAAIAQLKTAGFFLFKEKQRAVAISGSAQVVFLMHTRVGMIELVQL